MYAYLQHIELRIVKYSFTIYMILYRAHTLHELMFVDVPLIKYYRVTRVYYNRNDTILPH